VQIQPIKINDKIIEENLVVTAILLLYMLLYLLSIYRLRNYYSERSRVTHWRKILVSPLLCTTRTSKSTLIFRLSVGFFECYKMLYFSSACVLSTYNITYTIPGTLYIVYNNYLFSHIRDPGVTLYIYCFLLLTWFVLYGLCCIHYKILNEILSD
jgi:hypothetical protein